MKKLALGLLLFTSILYSKRSPNLFFLNSIPKAGTFLGVNVFAGFGLKGVNMRDADWVYKKFSFKSDEFPFFHVPYTLKAVKALERQGVKKTFLLMRDPRDQIIALAHFMYALPELNAPAHYNPFLKNKNMISDLITALIEDTRSLYEQYLPWMSLPRVLTIHFEDLVGPRGGGSTRKQLQTIRKMAKHIGLSPSDMDLKGIGYRLFGKSPTFRNGQIGEWKTTFTPEQKQLCKDRFGDLIVKLGYAL